MYKLNYLLLTLRTDNFLTKNKYILLLFNIGS